MPKYAVVNIYADGNGLSNLTHSKPTKTYDSLKKVRLAAVRARKTGKGGNWIVQLYSDDSARILGQVWYKDTTRWGGSYIGWTYEDKSESRDTNYELRKDGSLGRRL